jgi:hypothetical protein
MSIFSRVLNPAGQTNFHHEPAVQRARYSDTIHEMMNQALISTAKAIAVAKNC